MPPTTPDLATAAWMLINNDAAAGLPATDQGDDAGTDASKFDDKPQRPRADQALVVAALQRCTTPAQRRRIQGSRSLALVVRVPSAAWVKPVLDVLAARSRWNPAVDGSPTNRHAADVPGRIADALARGGRVVGVSPDPDRHLPRTLVAAADVTLDIVQPDDATVAIAIAAVCNGRPPRSMPSGIADGLDILDIISALRPGSTPAQCVARLVAAADARVLHDSAVADAPSLDDLHGYGAAMDWCRDLLADLGDWKCGSAPFPYASRAVLAGPPGTGKTTLVRSLAKTAGLPLIATSVAQWFGDSPGHLDSVVKAINTVWDQARACAPCVVLLDELDAVPNRATMDGRGRDWWTPVVTHLLLTLDSAVSGATKDLIVIGATNHVGDVDAALLRPGRLDQVIHVLPPDDPAVRVAMLRTHLRGDLADADLGLVGVATDGATGADLMGLVQAARRRARVARRPLCRDDLVAVAIPVSNVPDAVDQRCAVHEAGHAVVATALGLHVDTLSLLPVGISGGYMRYLRGDCGIHDRDQGHRYVQVLLAGTAAEEAVMNSRSTAAGGPAASDLGQATAMLAEYRYSHGLGSRLIHLGAGEDAVRRMLLDPQRVAEVEADLQRLYGQAKSLVVRHLGQIRALATELRRVRVMGGDAVRDVLRAVPVPFATSPPTSD